MKKLIIYMAAGIIAASALAYTMAFDQTNLTHLLDKGEVNLTLFNQTFDWSRQRGSYADWFADLRLALAKSTPNESVEEMYFYLSHQLTANQYAKHSPSFKRIVRSEVGDHRTATEIGWDQNKVQLRTFLALFGTCLGVNVRQYHDVIRVDVPGQLHLPGAEWMPEKKQAEQGESTVPVKAAPSASSPVR